MDLNENEEADRLAKQALQKGAIDLQVPLMNSEVKAIVGSKAVEECESSGTLK